MKIIIKIIKTFLTDLKENLIENPPKLILVGTNFITIAAGVIILSLLYMIPKEIGGAIGFVMLGIAIIMFSLYFWAKRYKCETKKWFMGEFIAVICGILGGVFVTFMLWLTFK